MPALNLVCEKRRGGGELWTHLLSVEISTLRESVEGIKTSYLKTVVIQ